MQEVKQYLINVGDALSQLINTMVFLGDAEESISGRSYREVYYNKDNKIWPHFYKYVNKLFFLQENHCKYAYLKDLERAKRKIKRHNQLSK